MKNSNMLKKIIWSAVIMSVMLSGCASTEAPDAVAENLVQTAQGQSVTDSIEQEQPVTEQEVASELLADQTVYEDDTDGGHAIIADGKTAEYQNASVNKTGNSDGDEADFYGENSAVFATNGAHLTLSDMDITTDGKHANAVFSYGEGTVVDVSDSVINTSDGCSGGIMTTGGGTMNASNLTIHTTGNSSAAIRSDRGGGTVTVTGGSYTTDGTGSPAIYSTAEITVNDAILTSTASQGVVVEGKNSVSLNNVTLNADNNKHNSDKSDRYEAVMIYQSMSGDADTGLSKFSADGGSIINKNGDIFFVNNTATDISLSDVDITNNGDGAFLCAAAAGWGKDGSNGGKVNLTASSQKIDGDMLVDDISVLNLYLKEGSAFTGAVNPDGKAGDVYIELTDGSKWTLTDDSYIKSLTCDTDSIELNGQTLTIDGNVYKEGEALSGEAIEIKIREEGMGGGRNNKPDSDNQIPQDNGTEPPQDGKKHSDNGDHGHGRPDGEPPQNKRL